MSRGRDRKASGWRDDEDFASRWSRMKRGSGAPVAEPQAAPLPAAETADERSDEEILRDLGLPDPETLKPGDDVRGFMTAAVPARLRNRVLRRLWHSNPVFANIDGLVDYGEDFTDAAMVPAVLETAYKVGRGWVRDAIEDEPGASVVKADDPRAAREHEHEQRTAEDELSGDEGPADEARGESPKPVSEMRVEEPQSGPPKEKATGRESGPQAGARRMRFRFGDE